MEISSALGKNVVIKRDDGTIVGKRKFEEADGSWTLEIIDSRTFFDDYRKAKADLAEKGRALRIKSDETNFTGGPLAPNQIKITVTGTDAAVTAYEKSFD